MQCNDCLHKGVCKHFFYAMKNSHVGIQINNCKLYSEIIQQHIPTQQPVVERDLSNGYADFSSLSNASAPISAIPVEINKVACDRCKNEVLSIDADNCSECGRLVCNDCRVDTFDPEKGIVTSICEKCWSGKEDPIPGEAKKVSITFEKEKDEWDLEDFKETNEDVIISKEEEQNVESKSTKQMANKRPTREHKKQ